jgi:hypothetical protein
MGNLVSERRALKTMEDLDVKSKINDILSRSKSNPVIQRCIGALERTPAIKMSRDIVVNTKEILSTYRLRVEMHRSVIEGGDDLVSALEMESSKKVRINWVKTDEEEFFIFTDPELKKLIGCISVSTERG